MCIRDRRKIFFYECKRLLWNKFFLGLLLVLLFYGWQVLSGATILGVSHTAPFSPCLLYTSFSMPVLLEKIRVILRRSSGNEGAQRLKYRDLEIDPDTREVTQGGRALELTAREFELLRTFIASPGRVFTREMLLAKLWGYDFYGDERVVDSHIKNLRHKLERDYIETVRGVGYRVAKETC